MAIPRAYQVTWSERAACAGTDMRLFFSSQPGAAQTICSRCQVRPECLYDALQHEPNGHRYGVRGGLTATERTQLPDLPGKKADAITMLHALLQPAQDHAHTPDGRTEQPMSGTPTAPSPTLTPEDPKNMPVGRLLKWADEHPVAEVRDQAAQARAALASLRQRHAADQELTAIHTEREQLETRLAELQARQHELAPPQPKRRRPVTRDYDTREVRAWADANGVDCPRVGQVPKRVLDVWHATHDRRKEATDADA